jgi:ABC-type polar amino acid transport system ATPase subunit
VAQTVTALDVRGLAVRRGTRLVVQDVSFAADRGELVALMGPSGTGKTSVLRSIAGLDPVDAGEIHVDGVRLVPGRRPQGADARELYRRVGMVFQFHHLFSHLTALDNVCLAPVHARGAGRGEAVRRGIELLEMVGVGGRASAYPHELSGGEAQRVAIARALAVDPPVLLLDEPTASLDEGRREELAAILRGLASQGRTVVVSTHDRAFAAACADRIVLIDAGRVSETVEGARADPVE